MSGPKKKKSLFDNPIDENGITKLTDDGKKEGMVAPIGLRGQPNQRFSQHELRDTYAVGEPTQKNLDFKRYRNQGAMSVVLNTIGSGVVGGIGTLIEDIGYIGDVTNYEANLLGTKEVTKNIVSEIGKDINEWSREVMPIYTKDPSADWQWGWRSGAKAVREIIDMGVGFGVPGLGIAKGIRMLTRGKQFMKALRAISKGSKTQAAVESLSTAAIMNYGESSMMAVQTYDETMEYLKDKVAQGVISRAEAEGIANQRGAKMALWNKAFLPINMLQLRGIMSTASGVRNQYSKNKTRDFIKNRLYEGFSEGFLEEGPQGVMQRELMYRTEKEFGDAKKSSFQSRLAKYIKEPDLIYESLIGMFGGMVELGIIAELKEFKSDKLYESQKKYVESLTKLSQDAIAQELELQKLDEDASQFSQKFVEMIGDRKTDNMIIGAMNTGTLDHLENTLDGIMSDENESAESKEVAKKIRERLGNLENRYSKLLAYENPAEIMNNELTLERLENFKEAFENYHGENKAKLSDIANKYLTKQDGSPYKGFENATVTSEDVMNGTVDGKEATPNQKGQLTKARNKFKRDYPQLFADYSETVRVLNEEVNPAIEEYKDGIAILRSEKHQEKVIKKKAEHKQKIKDEERKENNEKDKKKKTEEKLNNINREADSHPNKNDGQSPQEFEGSDAEGILFTESKADNVNKDDATLDNEDNTPDADATQNKTHPDRQPVNFDDDSDPFEGIFDDNTPDDAKKSTNKKTPDKQVDESPDKEGDSKDTSRQKWLVKKYLEKFKTAANAISKINEKLKSPSVADDIKAKFQEAYDAFKRFYPEVFRGPSQETTTPDKPKKTFAERANEFVYGVAYKQLEKIRVDGKIKDKINEKYDANADPDRVKSGKYVKFRVPNRQGNPDNIPIEIWLQEDEGETLIGYIPVVNSVDREGKSFKETQKGLHQKNPDVYPMPDDSVFEAMKDDIRNIRKQILEDDNLDNQFYEIKDVSNGKLIKHYDETGYVKKPIKERFENEQLELGFARENRLVKSNGEILPTSQHSNKPEDIVNGAAYVMLPVNRSENGDLIYHAIPVYGDRISDLPGEVFDTIMEAINVWRNNINNDFYKAWINTKDGKGKNYDLHTTEGLSKFMSLFLPQINLESGTSLFEYLKSNPKSSESFSIAVRGGKTSETGSIEFSDGMGNGIGGTDKSFIVKSNDPATQKQAENRMEDLMYAIESSRLTFKIDSTKAPKSIPINKNGEIVRVNYLNDFVKRYGKTDVREINIGSKYAYVHDRKITIDYKKGGSQDSKNLNEEVIDNKPDKSKAQVPDFFPDLNVVSEFKASPIVDTTTGKVIKEGKEVTKQLPTVEGMSFANLKTFIDNVLAKHIQKVLEYEKAEDKSELEKPLLRDQIDSMLDEAVTYMDAVGDNYESQGNPDVVRRVFQNMRMLDGSRDQIYELSKIFARRITKFSANEDYDIDSEGLEKTNYDDDFALTVNDLDKASTEVKTRFAFIREMTADKDGHYKPVQAATGTKFVNFQDAYYTTHHLLADVSEHADFDRYAEELEKHIDNHPWLVDLLDRKNPYSIYNMSEKAKNEFASNMTKNLLRMHTLSWSRTKNGFSWNLIDINSTSSKNNLLRDWRTNFLNESWVSRNGDGTYTLDKTSKKFLEKIIKEYDEITTPQQASEWLDNFGIEIESKVFENLHVTPYTYSQNKVTNVKELFTGKLKGGVLKRFAQELLRAYEQGKSIDEGDLFRDSSVVAFAELASQYKMVENNSTLRAGSKSIYTYTMPRYLWQRMVELNNSEIVKNRIRTNYFSKHSKWLEEAVVSGEKKPLIEQAFIGMVSPSDQREIGKAYSSRTGIAKRERLEHEMVKIVSYFANENRPRIILPTFSDKKHLFSWDLNRNHIAEINVLDLGEDKNFVLDDAIFEEIFERMLLPEMVRYLKKQPEFEKRHPSFKEAKKIMFSFPGVKELTYDNRKIFDDRNNEIYLTEEKDGELIFSDDGVRQELINYVKETSMQMIRDKVKDWNNLNAFEIMDDQVKDRYEYQEVFEPLGEFKPRGKTGKELAQARKEHKRKAEERNEIIKEQKRKQNKAKLAMASEYAINQMLAIREFENFVGGDPALYFKKNYVQTLSNIGKRYAGINGPTNKGRNFQYQYVIAEDPQLDSEVEELRKMGYSNIDVADAQQFITPLHYAERLYSHGQIEKSMLDAIRDKQEKQAKRLRENKTIGSTAFTDEQLKTLRQPIKPMHFGQNTEGHLEYFKSSAVALIPQQATPDRRKMISDMFENDIQSFMFKTASKLENAPAQTMFDENGHYTGMATEAGEGDNAVSLVGISEYKYDGIQQEVPFKEKETSIDGSQHRILVHSQTYNKTILDGKKEVSGKEHRNNYYRTYSDLYDARYEMMLLEFGAEYNEEGDIDFSTINKSKLQARIIEEAIARNYPQNQIDQLIVSEDSFKIPLVLNSSSSAVQSLLMSMLHNSITKIENKGIAYVLQTDIGIKVKAQEDFDYESYPGFTPLDNYDPEKGLLPMRRSEDGKEILPGQVIVPFRFKDKNGNWLKLSDYTIKKDGKTLLDTNRIDKDVLKMFGFRIPTQLHSSMHYVEVAGFLPETQGTTIIAPKELIFQMGSDFDVDKFFTHGYNYSVTKDGKILQKRYSIFDPNTGEERHVKDIINEGLISFRTERNKSPELFEKTFGDGSVEEQYSNALKMYSEYLMDETLRMKIDVARSPEMYEIFMKPLLFGKFRENSEVNEDQTLEELFESFQEAEKEYQSHYSDTYQREKYLSAKAGKAGIGAFSAFSVFMASIENSNVMMSGVTRPLRSLHFGKKDNRSNIVKTENGYGYRYNLSPISHSNRSIIDVIAAYQSASVDNEKERILDTLHITEDKFGAIQALIAMGYEETEISLFLHHPAIELFLEEFRREKSEYNFGSTSIDKMVEEILSPLVKDVFGVDSYNELKEMSGDSEDGKNINIRKKQMYEDFFDDATPKNMAQSIRNGIPDFIKGDLKNLSEDQKLEAIATISTFAELEIKGRILQEAGSTYNSDSKGPGKSFSSLSAKLLSQKNVEKTLPGLTQALKGTVKDSALRNLEKGMIALYQDTYPTAMIDELAEVMTSMLGKTEPWEIEQVYDEIQSNMRGFILAGAVTQVSEFPTVNQLRKSLAKPSLKAKKRVTATLADIIYDLKKKTDYRFLKALDVEFSDKPFDIDLIKFSKGYDKSFDIEFHLEIQQLYNDVTTELGTYRMNINGKTRDVIITPRKLVEYLVMYQSAINKQVSPHSLAAMIPENVMDKMGVTTEIKELYSKLSYNDGDIISEKQDNYLRQIVQANPQLAEFNKDIRVNQKMSREKAKSRFIFRYDSNNKAKKFKLFEREKVDDQYVYKEIPVTSRFNQIEFDPFNNVSNTVQGGFKLNSSTPVNKSSKRSINTVGDALSILIAQPETRALGKSLKGIVDDVKVRFEDNLGNMQAVYNTKTNEIIISTDVVNERGFNEVLAEEILHAVFVNELKKDSEQFKQLNKLRGFILADFLKKENMTREELSQKVSSKLDEKGRPNSTFTPKELLMYRLDTMDEFIPGMFRSDQMLYGKLKAKTFKNKSGLQWVVDLVNDVLKRLGVIDSDISNGLEYGQGLYYSILEAISDKAETKDVDDSPNFKGEQNPTNTTEFDPNIFPNKGESKERKFPDRSDEVQTDLFPDSEFKASPVPYNAFKAMIYSKIEEIIEKPLNRFKTLNDLNDRPKVEGYIKVLNEWSMDRIYRNVIMLEGDKIKLLDEPIDMIEGSTWFHGNVTDQPSPAQKRMYKRTRRIC